VAVQGCSHGELDSIYDAIESYQRDRRSSNDDDDDDPNSALDSNSPSSVPRRRMGNIDVLLCCGDVETMRNADDIHSLNVPPKYKNMGDFHEYYSGRKVAPILTIVIGGNHEASNYLQELHYGGWLAPNIYYLGAAGVVNLRKWTRTGGNDGVVAVSTLRIGGVSGIYNSRHYRLGRYEYPPYDADGLRSVYHTREVDVKRLLGMQKRQPPIDIFMSHDWPRGIAYHGNLSQLLQRKPFFRQDIETGELGSPANEDLLKTLRPRYWFSAHLHVKFEALVRHESANDEIGGKSEERIEPSENIDTTEFIGLEANDGVCPASSNIETLTEQMTRFLSLDKCLPKRRHIQITYLEPSSSVVVDSSDTCAASASSTGECGKEAWLEYDATWLAMLRRTHHWTKRTRNVVVANGGDDPITEMDIEDVVDRFRVNNCDGSTGTTSLTIPQNFLMTVTPYDPSTGLRSYGPPPPMMGNPQTDDFLGILGLEHCITVPYSGASKHRTISFPMQPPRASGSLIPLSVMHQRVTKNTSADDKNEIDLVDDTDDAGNGNGNDSIIKQEDSPKEREQGIGLDDGHDPDEIDLEEKDDEQDENAALDDDVAGDANCSPPQAPVSAAKKARTDDA
jgi:lariat debranching enzyme